MKQESGRNIAASVRQRLINRAHERREEPKIVFLRYALERLLYRLSCSPHRDRFVLKGAMLFHLWDEATRRPTRDIDLLSFGERDIGRYEGIFREVCDQVVEEDGLLFQAASVRGAVIKEGEEYEGIRIRLVAHLASARLPVQIDIGFGDAVTPDATSAIYPTMLELPAPVLQMYPVETVVAEKLQAMVALGMANSRMKDFFDVWALSRIFAFDGGLLSQAFGATFDRRRTPLPTTPPVALTPAFSESPAKQAQWRAFLAKGRVTAAPAELAVIAQALRDFLMPPTLALAAGERFEMHWPVGGALDDRQHRVTIASARPRHPRS